MGMFNTFEYGRKYDRQEENIIYRLSNKFGRNMPNWNLAQKAEFQRNLVDLVKHKAFKKSQSEQLSIAKTIDAQNKVINPIEIPKIIIPVIVPSEQDLCDEDILYNVKSGDKMDIFKGILVGIVLFIIIKAVK